MAWADVPAKITKYNSLEYADDTKGTTPSEKLVRQFTNGVSGTDINLISGWAREDFEQQLDYRIGACENLAKSRAIDPKKLRGAPGKP